jgi:hypothetical protein
MTNGRRTAGENGDRILPRTFMAGITEEMVRRCGGIMKHGVHTEGAPREDAETDAEPRCRCGEHEGGRASTE